MGHFLVHEIPDVMIVLYLCDHFFSHSSRELLTFKNHISRFDFSNCMVLPLGHTLKPQTQYVKAVMKMSKVILKILHKLKLYFCH